MMDSAICTEFQQIVSAAYDGQATDPEALASAKEHCRTCPECAAFVSLLAEARRLPAPELPAEVLERTLAAVRAEMAADSAAEAPVPAPAPGPADEPTPADESTQRVQVLPRPRWHTWAPWAAAAAVFFLFAGIATIQGVRFLLAPSPDLASVALDATESETRLTETPATEDGPDALGAPEPGAVPAEDVAYVTVADAVYRFDAQVAEAPVGEPAGTLTSSLGTTGVASARDFYRDAATGAITVADDDGAFLRFAPVTRTLQGRPYELRSPAITAFGTWPTLPAGIPQPSSPEGAPEFIPAGSDDTGVAIYIRPGTDPSAGFAVAPGTSPADPAAANPGWTWWAPVTR